MARARDGDHATRLTRLGATGAIPETVEASLQLAGRLLENLDFPDEVAIQRIAEVRAMEVVEVRKASKTADAAE